MFSTWLVIAWLDYLFDWHCSLCCLLLKNCDSLRWNKRKKQNGVEGKNENVERLMLVLKGNLSNCSRCLFGNTQIKKFFTVQKKKKRIKKERKRKGKNAWKQHIYKCIPPPQLKKTKDILSNSSQLSVIQIIFFCRWKKRE